MRRPVRLLARDQVNVVLVPLAIEFGEIDAVQLGRSVTIVSETRAKYARCSVETVIFHSLLGLYFVPMDSTSFQSIPLSLMITRYLPVHTRFVNVMDTG
jgi:hypothetical protein